MSASVVIGDWGSTRLRLWRLERGEVAERLEGPGILACADPAAALAAVMAGRTADRVVLCGMAGAREGLHEAPYVACPVSLSQWRARATQGREGSQANLRIAAGISCRDLSGHPDVMRGEETQVFGAMTLDPVLASGRHIVLLPGTHSKWVWLADGVIAGFRTCLTGELFALLGQSSLLAAGASGANEDSGFAAGLARASEGAAPSVALFEARAAQLVDGRTVDWARGFVSGLLIGAEIVEMAPQDTVLAIGDPALLARYREALAQRGVPMHCMDGEACAIAGLRLLDDD